jgi:hypothetical protein
VDRIGEGIAVSFASGILYPFDSDQVLPAGRENLRQLAQSLQQYPETEVLIVGHTDSSGRRRLQHEPLVPARDGRPPVPGPERGAREPHPRRGPRRRSPSPPTRPTPGAAEPPRGECPSRCRRSTTRRRTRPALPLVGGAGVLPRRPGERTRAVRHRDPAAQRDGGAAHGARAQQHHPGRADPLAADAGARGALAAGDRPRRGSPRRTWWSGSSRRRGRRATTWAARRSWSGCGSSCVRRAG